jgi:hypothetical protein
MLELSSATTKDLLRRPSTRLAIAAAAALVALIPHVPAPGASSSDQIRLTLEFGATTIILITHLFAGITAVHAASGDADRGFAPEIQAAPRRPHRTHVERFLGILGATTLVLAGLATVAVLAWVSGGVEFAKILPMLGAFAATIPSAAAFAAFGIAVGRFARSELAVLLVIFVPWVPGALHAAHAPELLGAAVGAVLPPISGPIHPRDVAFDRGVAATAAGISIAVTLLQTTAWLILASTPPRVRATTSQESS